MTMTMTMIICLFDHNVALQSETNHILVRTLLLRQTKLSLS